MNDTHKILIVLLAIVLGLGAYTYYDKHKSAETPDNIEEKMDDWKTAPEEEKISEVEKEPATYAEFLVAAKKKNMKIILFFQSEGCRPCENMKSNVFTNADVKKTMSKFLFLAVDADNDAALVSKYKVRATPTTVVIDADEKVYKTIVGNKLPVLFVKELNEVL